MRQRRKGYLFALIAVSTIITAWNAIDFFGLIDEQYGPAQHLPLHNVGLATVIVLAILYRGERDEDIAGVLRSGVELGEMIGAEKARLLAPKQTEHLEVVAIVPLQKNSK